jgi:hypothetical protein
MKTKSTTGRQTVRKPKAKTRTRTRTQAQQAQAPQRVLDRGDPMKSARILMADYFVHGGLQTLWRHRNEFWLWHGNHYQITSAEMLRTHIWKFLERSLRIEAKTGATVPFKPTPQLVGAVADGLSAV